VQGRKSMKNDLKCEFITVKPFPLIMLSYIVDAYGKPLLFSVERQAEPSISPEKWPAGVYQN
jgi:hypothetical protein